MNKLKALYSERAELLAAREELLTQDAPLSEEQKTEDTRLEAKIDSMGERIDALEKIKAEKAREFMRRDNVVSTTPAPVEASTVEVGEPGFVADPKKGFAHIKEFLLAAKANSAVCRDERLIHLDANRAINAAAGADENMTASNPYAGFLVPTGLAAGVLSITPEDDFLSAFTTSVAMDVPQVAFNAQVDTAHNTSVAGGLTVSRTPETQPGTSSRLKFEQIMMDAKELVGLSYATNRILQYSPSSFVSMLQANFSKAFAGQLLDERLNGNGTDEMQGVLSAACKVAQAEEATQTNATIIYENIINMRSRCYGYQDAIWVANHDTLPQLMTMAFTSSAIAPIWQPSLREDHPDMLLGRPLFFTEYCQTLGTEGDIMLLNMSQYLEGTLQPLQSAESIHVRFENRESTFRFTMANDGKLWWTAALTPRYSSTTLSPVVTLATRA